MQKREFFINAVEMIDVEGNKNIPTVLYYQKDKSVRIGSSALAAAKTRLEINEDFKVDLGFLEQKFTSFRRKYPTASGYDKSADALTSDFLEQVFLNGVLRNVRDAHENMNWDSRVSFPVCNWPQWKALCIL